MKQIDDLGSIQTSGLTQIEKATIGVPVILLATDKTVAWKMKEGLGGKRYGKFYECKEGLTDEVVEFLLVEANKVISSIALDHGA